MSKIKVMFATAAHCVSVTGWNLLDDLNKRLMLNNKFQRRTIENPRKTIEIFEIINDKLQQKWRLWKE